MGDPFSLGGTGTLQVDAGGTLALQSFGTYASSLHFLNNGTIEALSAAFGGTLTVGSGYQGTGDFLIQGGTASSAKTALNLGAGVSGNVRFDPNFGALILALPSSFNGVVAGFGGNDSIVLQNLKANAASLSGNILTITNNGSIVQTLTIDTNALNYGSATFSVVNGFPINSDSTVTVNGVTPAACYRAGTLIRTPTGEVAVEHLRPGMFVSTRFAGAAPVVWIGHRGVDCRAHPDPAEVWPVRVAVDAFGPGMPRRELFLSPDHAVFVDDVLIPIKHLVDGGMIASVSMPDVTYYHVEVAEHDVVWAEGMPAETYLENSDRAAFDNGGDHASPIFGAARREGLGCAPLLVAGSRFDAVRNRLGTRNATQRRGLIVEETVLECADPAFG